MAAVHHEQDIRGSQSHVAGDALRMMMLTTTIMREVMDEGDALERRDQQSH